MQHRYANESKARVGGHPLHPMLIPFPIAFYTGTLAGLIAYSATGNVFWYRLAYVLNAAALIMAVIAAIPGVIDWASGIRSKTEAKRDATTHMALNITVLGLFAINFFGLMRPYWDDAIGFNASSAILVSGLGVLLLVAAGALGWRLVQTHHVGVQALPERNVEVVYERRKESIPVPVERRRTAAY